MNPSLFEDLIQAPPDPILGIATAYLADPNPDKVDLGVGAYRTENGQPYIFSVVEKVQTELIVNHVNKEYLPIDGLAELKTATQELTFGVDFPAIREQRIVSAQVLSGTGGLRVAGEFVSTLLTKTKEFYISRPSWPNHRNIFTAAGLEVKEYAYWDEKTRSLDIKEMLADLRSANKYSLVILHACAHNPTGVDPTSEQWKAILEVIQERRLIPLFDSAYQGYASGDLDRDAFAIRLFANAGVEMFVSQSFAKNMGLYGERIGMLHVVCHSSERAKIVLSQIKPIIRRMYSSPPAWGARLACGILSKEEYCKMWKSELRAIAGRIIQIRKRLCDGLAAKGTPGNWDHIGTQIGMFSYTGLTVAQCEMLTRKWHVYLDRKSVV